LTKIAIFFEKFTFFVK